MTSFFCSIVALCLLQQAVSQRPNVLFIMTDQQRYDAIGRVQQEMKAYEGKLKVRTPNLDRLSRGGAYFRTAYTQSPVCGPARTSLRTGCTIERTGVQTNPLSDEENARNPKLFQDKIDELEGLDQILVEDYGYVSEYYGKWHIPDRLHYSRDGRILSADGSNLTVQSNDYSYANDTFFFTTDDEEWSKKLRTYLKYFEKEGLLQNVVEPGQQVDTYTRYPYTPITLDSRYGLPTDTSLDGFSSFDQSQNSVMGNSSLPFNYTPSFLNHDIALRALERLAAQDKPFFLTVSQHHPHPPMMAPYQYFDYYWNQRDFIFTSPTVGVPLESGHPYHSKRVDNDLMSHGYCNVSNVKEWTAVYYSMIEEIDHLVGIMLDRLEELGIADNTMVIFTSDHGEMLGSHCLRGKSVFFEEAARVPLFIKYPGTIPSDTVVEAPVNHIDIFSTILDYVGASSSDKGDGKSLRGFIEGIAINFWYDETVAVSEWDFREPELNNTLSRNLDSRPNFMVRHGDFKLLMHKLSDSRKSDVLFDLENDPFEQVNLLGDDQGIPNDRVIGKAEHLRHLLLEWLERHDQGIADLYSTVSKHENVFYSDPSYNADEGLGDIAEIRNRQSWPARDIWVGSTTLVFDRPVVNIGATGSSYVQHEWLYVGRRTPGFLIISNMTVTGANSTFFRLSKSNAVVDYQGYFALKLSYESAVHCSEHGTVNAVLNIEHNVGDTIAVGLESKCSVPPAQFNIQTQQPSSPTSWSLQVPPSSTPHLNLQTQQPSSQSFSIPQASPEKQQSRSDGRDSLTIMFGMVMAGGMLAVAYFLYRRRKGLIFGVSQTKACVV